MTKPTLIPINYPDREHLLWVSEEEIKLNDFVLSFGKVIWQANTEQKVQAANNDRLPKILYCSNISAYPMLKGLREIELPKEDLDTIVENIILQNEMSFGIADLSIQGWVKVGIGLGYQAAPKNYSRKDIDSIVEFVCKQFGRHGSLAGHELDDFIQSLTPKSNAEIIGAEVVMEDGIYDIGVGGKLEKFIPKTYISKETGKECITVIFKYKD